MEIPEAARRLRLLAKHGETLQSHYLHLFFLAAPDFLGLPSVLPLLESALGGWRAPAGPPPTVNLSAPSQVQARAVTVIDKPGAAQSVIAIGAVGAPRATPDYFAIEVMHTILGGSFTSRLNQNLREQHGYAYGASSRFDMDPGDLVLLYTDGLTEAEDPAEEEFGVDRGEQVLARVECRTAETTCQELLREVESFVQGRPLADDATLVVVERLGGAG